MDKFNSKPDSTIYVGDNPQKDFYIKEILNIKTIRIHREKQIYTNAEYLNNVHEDYNINNLNELLNYIN